MPKPRGPLIEYKRNYERALDNDGFHHPENTDRTFNPNIVGGDKSSAHLFLWIIIEVFNRIKNYNFCDFKLNLIIF